MGLPVKDTYKAAVFWSFNDALEDSKLRDHLESLLNAGLMGGFLHSRVGLVTPYMSEEWLNRTAFCCEEAERLDTHLWLYDEDRWPSGYGGGQVLAKDASLKGKALCLIPEGDDRFAEQTLQVFKTLTVEAQTYTIALCELKTNNPWYSGGCYVDLLDPKTTDAFLETTHETYKKHLGQYFGGRIKGVFTDESCYIQKASFPYPIVPFTVGLEDRFAKEKGYSLTDNIEKLFFDSEGAHKVRFDFYDTVTRLFIESYTKRYQSWCHENTLKLTGHLMCEDTLTGQTEWVGAVMPHYAHMDIPGIDKLGTEKNQAVTVKQVTSVAAQLGKQSLCEALGCIGHQSGPKAMKALTDWLAVLGIGFINPHLTLYSMRGERKRDYPPNISPCQPWFFAGKGYFDHIARVSQLVSEGAPSIDVLIIHPMSSLWSEFSPLHKPNPTFSIWAPKNQYARANYIEEQERFEKPFFELTERLLAAGCPFHYGDEMVMEEHGGFDESRGLTVGQCAYTTVIVPPVRLLRQSTAGLLEKLADTYGPESVVFVEAMPYIAETEERIGSKRFTLVKTLGEAVSIANRRRKPHIEIRDVYTNQTAIDILYNHRTNDSDETVFVCNASGQERTVHITALFAEKPAAIDTVTGLVTEISLQGELGRYQMTVRLKAGGSLTLTTAYKAETSGQILMSGADLLPCPERHVLKMEQPTVMPDRPNLLPIDRVDFQAGDIHLTDAPIESLWYKVFYPLKNGTEFTASYSFTIEKMPDAPMSALVEMARNLDEILVNGQPAAITKTEYSQGGFDFSFDEILLTGLTEGVNTITLKGRKCNNIVSAGNHEAVKVGEEHHPTELESIFITGDFSVIPAGSRHSIYGNGELPKGNVTKDGYPFYNGDLVAECTVDGNETTRITVDAQAASVRLTINDTFVKDAYLPPFDFDVTGLLTQEKNKLRIEALGDLANTFGPLHLKGRKELPMISPFLIADMSRYTERPELFDFGIDSVTFLT